MRLLILMLLSLSVAAQQDLRYGKDHRDFGLPKRDAAWLPYSADPEHCCNRIWRAIYLIECVPSEIGLALPTEHDEPAEFFVPGWYFKKRKGKDGDKRLFGGDGRQVPVEGFDPAREEQLIAALQELDGAIAAELKSRPRAAVWMQHDLLRLARRLLSTRQNKALLRPLLACARRIALPRATLLSAAVRTTDVDEIARNIPGFRRQDAIEVQRRSTRLFDAEFVQLWSSIYLATPNVKPEATASWLTADERRGPLPMHTMALLIQGIVAVDNEGVPCATDLVIEARTQRLTNRSPLAFDNRTTTRDGIDFAMWSLPRRAIRDLDAETKSVPFATFRGIDMASQELFRDYGALKHTTYAAQCTLCHRRSNAPDEPLAGFSAVRISSNPRPAQPGERKHQAEREMLRFLDKLRGK